MLNKVLILLERHSYLECCNKINKFIKFWDLYEIKSQVVKFPMFLTVNLIMSVTK